MKKIPFKRIYIAENIYDLNQFLERRNKRASSQLYQMLFFPIIPSNYRTKVIVPNVSIKISRSHNLSLNIMLLDVSGNLQINYEGHILNDPARKYDVLLEFYDKGLPDLVSFIETNRRDSEKPNIGDLLKKFGLSLL